MSKLLKFGFVLLIIITSSCSGVGQSIKLEYNLSQPSRIMFLPDTLHEISGITYIGNQQLACVQDENGVVFYLNLTNDSIANFQAFNENGDYEGIAKTADSLFILRSDGKLFRIENYLNPQPKVSVLAIGIPAKNNEGLCYDPERNRLLIGCKSNTGGKQNKFKRAIYAYCLNRQKLSPAPVFEFNLIEIQRYAKVNDIKPPLKTKKNGKQFQPEIKFRISAIALHPNQKHLYVLSATDYMLFVFDLTGKILYAESLNPEIFLKAEGISFAKQGTLIVSNEGKNLKPNLLFFKHLAH